MVDGHDKAQSEVDTNRLHFRAVYQDGKHGANQLDGEQRQSGFDYYEYNMPKFGTPGWAQWAQCSLDRSSLNFQEHSEDLEHNEARYQGIDSHGRDQTC